MIFTLRSFQVERKDHAEFADISEQRIWPDLEEKGARPIGLWTVVLGGAERILVMTRYDSLAHWQETRGWYRTSGASSARAELVRDTSVIALRLLTRRYPKKDDTSNNPGIYTIRTFDVRDNDVDRLVHLSEERWWHWAETGLRHMPLGQWISIIAPEKRIYMMTRYDDMAHWEQTRDASPEPSDPELKRIWADGYAAVRERSRMCLSTSVQILRPITGRRPIV
ncbi:MAG: NIPSNAP family protein [Spirochaetaceae bacterium]|nr:NIPSNAP family protein [Spirochaetaceae bacterium]